MKLPSIQSPTHIGFRETIYGLPLVIAVGCYTIMYQIARYQYAE
jgi:hypothetical protein